jgi:Tfp pilus assembly protein PilO
MTTRDRTVIAVVVMIAALVGGWLLFVAPKRSQASKLQSEIAAAQTQLQTAQASVASGLAAKASYATFYAELARLGEAVPDTVDTPSLIYQVQSAASASNVDFRTLTVGSGSGSSSSASAPAAATPTGAATTTNGVTSQPISFTFTGSFFNVAGFMARLERFVVATNKRVAVSGRLMTLNTLAITAGPKGFPQITAQINATSYLIPPASPTTPAAGSTTAVSGTTSTTSPAAPAAVTAPVK